MVDLKKFGLPGIMRRKVKADLLDESAETPDVWEEHVSKLNAHGVPEPGSMLDPTAKSPTREDINESLRVSPSFVKRLPWVEFLGDSDAMLLEDNESVAAFFELTPVGTEGREPAWLQQVRDAVENALQDSFEELEDSPWVVQFYAQDEANWDSYMDNLGTYIQPRAQGTAFTEHYLRFFGHHLKSIAKPGGLFEDTTISKLPWRGQQRRVRLVIYRWSKGGSTRKGHNAEQSLNAVCDRFVGGVANAGVVASRLKGAAIHDWLLRWFNPKPTHIQDKDEFYRLAAYPDSDQADEIELASGRDFSERLFFSQPRSDSENGAWLFDQTPHRVVVVDRLRSPPMTGHLTGETRKGGDAINALFDQLPEDTVLSITLVITPQDILEAQLNKLGKKAVGETLASEQARADISAARSIIGSSHKLYRGTVAFYIRGEDIQELDSRSLQLNNVLLNNGILPVRDEDEVGPLNSYLRWLPCCFDPKARNASWYTQLMFAQHIANLCPVWGRSQGTGHPGLTLFNRGGGTITFDPLNGLDRQMNAHLFLFGPTGSGKSATLNYLLNQVTAVYRPRLFIVEAGNSFGLYADFCVRLGLTVNKVKLAPGSGISLAPFAEAWRLVETPSQLMTVNPELDDDLDDDLANSGRPLLSDETDSDERRDILGELEIVARLMITGGEAEEERRLTRADRSRIRKCIIDAAHVCSRENRTVMTRDVRDALKREAERNNEVTASRLSDMADAMDIFCQGTDGQMFDRDGSPWPEADITIVDLATYAREGYSAQLSISYISLINTVNNIAERDQMLGRPIINVTDEGHIITKNPLLSPYVVKITKMWRKLGAWFWLATQNLDDLPKAAEPMLNMIEWWICLSMPPDEVEKIARFRSLNDSQKALMLSARKEKNKFAEGVVLSKSMEMLFRTVPPSLYLAMAMTEPEEKNARFKLMQEHGIDELDAAIMVAEAIDQARGIPLLDRGEMAASPSKRRAGSTEVLV
ncbi:hypothetical protein ALO41_200149 [Pseudomonas amygdali pv. ulmi]|uniref:Conjugative transfer ATPase n=2 Tax=Pseudomonas syringae group TaxID=136849 RepID=A0A0Q0GFP6_PSEA0|nr:hypothetical protein ALO41_200149 [Pseudomonas amygdali pv. ulmi]